MNGEEFRRDVSNSLTKLVTLQEVSNNELKLMRENMVEKEDHIRLESKVEKIWDRVLVMGVAISAIATAVGVVGWGIN